MDINKKLIDQLSDLSRNIKSLTSEVKNNNISTESDNSSKENSPNKKSKSILEDQNSNFLKSLKDIFKKGISEMSKSNLETSNSIKNQIKENTTKGLESITKFIPEVKEKKLSEIVGKSLKSGNVIDKNKISPIDKKVPIVGRLEKKSTIITNNKISENKNLEIENNFKENKPSIIQTADQNLNLANKKNKEITPEESKSNILTSDINPYNKYLEELKSDSLNTIKNIKESFTKEDVQKLNKPESKLKTEPDRVEINSGIKQNQNKEINLKNLLNPPSSKEKKETKLENSQGKINRGKEFLEKEKNVFLSKSKDILSNPDTRGKIEKIGSSLLDNKNSLLSKNIGISTQLIGNKDRGIEKIEKIKEIKDTLKKKNPEEEKSKLFQDLPQLKKVQPKQNKEEISESKNEPKPKSPRENKKEEKKEETKSKEEIKTTSPDKITKKETKDNSISVTDLDDIKILLAKMVSLLEGPLFMETMDSPFRPDSRRF